MDSPRQPQTRYATPDELFRRLAAIGIETTTLAHPPVFTVAESQDLRGELPGAHCKSLFLRDKKGAQYLVVAMEDRQLDLKALSGILGSGRLSFGSAERLMAALGVVPGSVTPFAAINDPGGTVRIFLDADVMAAELANFHPLSNDMTTAIRPRDLLRFLVECGHDPVIADLAPATR